MDRGSRSPNVETESLRDARFAHVEATLIAESPIPSTTSGLDLTPAVDKAFYFGNARNDVSHGVPSGI